ncbi:MAG: DegT/DnrJ/EryC1/StrS family aminotransferase [Syntrophobacteraceae bacterium]
MNHFIPQTQPWFGPEEKQAVADYMESGGWVTEFVKTREFARVIAEYTGAGFCSVLSNGSVTLTAALLACGIGRDDEVVVPAYTMIATANAVPMACGAKPVFADIERETMCLDLDSLMAACTPNTKAVMLVSINGRYPEKLEGILRFSRQRDIKVIEDAAQSLGSYCSGRHAGRFGECGSFSFSMPKIITTGQGGALITDDEELYRKIELVRNFGRKQAGVDDHVFFGTNFKFTDLQAVVGIEQMKKLQPRVQRKREIYKVLQEELSDVPGVKFFATSDDATPWFNDILVEDPASLQEHLKANNIGSRPFYPPLHTQAPYNMQKGLFPNAEYISSRGLWLPSYAQLTQSEIERITTVIRNYFSA